MWNSGNLLYNMRSLLTVQVLTDLVDKVNHFVNFKRFYSFTKQFFTFHSN